MRKGVCGLVVGLASLLASTGAVAGSLDVQMKFAREDLGQQITFSFNGHAETAFAGLYDWTGFPGNKWPLDRPFQSFCIDLNQTFTSGVTYQYTLRPLETSPVPDPDPTTAVGMGTDRANALRRLWGQDRWTVKDGVTAAAFQVAIWEIVFETIPSYAAPVFDVAATVKDPRRPWSTINNPSRGSFYLDPSTKNYADIVKAATGYLADAVNPYSKSEPMLMALSNPDHQDQLVVMPLPATAWGGAVVLSGMAGLATLRRRGSAVR